MRRRYSSSGVVDINSLLWAAKLGFSDEALSVSLKANFPPYGSTGTAWTFLLFNDRFPEFRKDPRFVALCARLGLIDYWAATHQWPDCAEEVLPYYNFKVECQKTAAGPPLSAAIEVAPTR